MKRYCLHCGEEIIDKKQGRKNYERRKFCSISCKIKSIDFGSFRRGKKNSEEHNRKISDSQSGEKSNLYIDGRSKLNNPYPEDWTELLRNSIRERDSFMCQECGVHQDELTGRIKKLHVHHIDYDKDNLDPENLISLCNSCHIKTNFNREYWKNYFSNKIY